MPQPECLRTSMESKSDLTEGPILSKLIKLSMPIVGTIFVQMAYNLTDVIWLGRSGSVPVTAVTTAGFFMWLLASIFYCTKSGTETLVAQSVGKKDFKMARLVAENALALSLYASLIANLLVLVFSGYLLQFFTLDTEVMSTAVSYLRIVSFGMLFAVVNPVLSSVYIGFGDSKTPFMLSSVGLVINMILDPALIFGFLFIPPLGADGAAIATVFANVLVFLLFVFAFHSPRSVLPGLRFFAPLKSAVLKKVLKIGAPVSVHQISFCLFSMFLGRLVSVYGTIPLGVQNIGASIEALSWNTAIGFSSALGAFTGQNYGAGKHERIRNGYFVIASLSITLGLVATVAFLFFGEEIFSLFSQEEEMITIGATYLKILAVSQIFMCIEITSAGGFYGLGKTTIPSAVSVIFTGMRIPAALAVITYTSFSYEGIWWCVSISSVFKGIIVAHLYCLMLRKLSKQ